MRKFLLIYFSLCLCLGLRAQTEVYGTVEDVSTGKPVDGASITLLRKGNPMKLAFSKADGTFSLNIEQLLEADSLNVSCLGYARKTVSIPSSRRVEIRLKAEAFVLREVNVRGNRTISRADTTVYDLTRFATERDNSLKDVLRKLTGVEISDNGEIQVNGKAISRFTVEGLDMTGGRYNQLEENIKAKDVKKAEVIDHDQPIKALQDKVFTDDVAMNIVMKDEARDRLLFTLKPYMLVGETKTVGGKANALQIGKKRQLSYDAAYDRTGKDLSQLSGIQATYRTGINAAEVPSWLNSPSLIAPIDAERLRFNTSQRYAINRIQKSDNDHELRFSANYLRTVERQDTRNESAYDLGGAEPVKTSQKQHLYLVNDNLSLELERKTNTATAYGNSQLKIDACRTDGLSIFSDSLSQRVKTPQVDVIGKLYRLYTLGKSQLTVNAVADYHHAENELDIAYQSDTLQGRTSCPTEIESSSPVGHKALPCNTTFRSNLWHAAAGFGWMKKRNYFTHQLTALVEAQNLNVAGKSMTLVSSEVTPYWQYKKGMWLTSISSHVRWERYPNQNETFFLWKATAYVRWKGERRSEWNGSVNYNESTGNAEDFVLKHVRKDYRSYFTTDGSIPKNRSLYSSFQYLYKRPIQELFFNADINAGRTWRDMTRSLEIVDGIYYTSLVSHHSQSTFVQAESALSKGFFALNLKTRLAGSVTYNKGVQLSALNSINYETMNYKISPNIEFSPKWGALSYRGDFQWQHSKGISTLFDWRQRLSLTSTIGKIDLTLSAIYYHNELQSGNALNTMISDADAVWRIKKARISLAFSNLFNKKDYFVSQYSGISTFTDYYRLRGRELLLSIQFNI